MEFLIKKHNTLAQVIRIVSELEDTELTLIIEKEALLFNRISNLRILSKLAKLKGKNIKLITEDPKGKKMVNDIFYENNEEVDLSRYSEDTVSSQNQLELSSQDSLRKANPIKSPIIGFAFLKSKLPLYISGALGLVISLIFISYFYIQQNLSANLQIYVSSERFVKSQNTLLSATKNTDISNKILRGDLYRGQITVEKEIPTTGSIEKGVKASGEVKVINKSDNEIKLTKGEKLRIKKGEKEFQYELVDEVKLEPRKLESTSPDIYLNTEKTVEVVALDFGANYNLAVGEGLRFLNYTNDTLSSEVTKTISGGLKEDLQAVSSDDIKKVYQESLEEIKNSFKPQDMPGKIFLKGSEQFSVTKTTYSHQVDEESEKLKLTLTAEVNGLMYDVKELENFMRSSFRDLLPPGFEIYGKEVEVEANLLGKTSSSILTSTEADIVVTVKTYVVPIVNIDEIKDRVRGKSISELESTIQEIPNVINYDLSLNMGIPFFTKMPSDAGKINVSIFRK